VTAIELHLQLPDQFPSKYVDAIQRAVDHCAVKRAIVNPPELRVQVVQAALC
jgi:ribosomal protein S12 methylthiotransferase accessory factor